MSSSFRTALVLIAALATAACAGSPTYNHVLPAAASSVAASAKHRSKLVLRVHVPRKVRRRGHFVSPSTQSLTLALTPAAGCGSCSPASSSDYGLTAQSPDCTNDASGVTCQIQLGLAPGNYTGKVATYDGSAGCEKATPSCNTLSQNQSFPLKIAAGESNVPSIVLSGVVGGFLFVNLTPATLEADATRNLISLAPGTSGRFELLPQDADGNIILGPGTPNFSVGSGSVFSASTSGNIVTLSAPPQASGGRYYLPVSLKSCASSCSLGNIGVSFLTLVAEGYTGGNTVVVLPTLLSSTTPLAVVTNGIKTPQAEIFDSAGNLFVANAGNDTVTEYAPPYSGAPVATLTGVASPNLLAMDSSGDLAVSSTTGSTLHVYLHGAFGSPLNVSLAADPSELKFDSKKNLWIAYPTLKAVGRYPPTGPNPYSIPDVGVSTPAAPNAIALDYDNGMSQSDNLYVVNAGGAVTVYDSGSSYALDGYYGITLAGAASIATCQSSLLSTNYMAISATGTTDFFYTPNVMATDVLFNLIGNPFPEMVFDQNCDLYAASGSYVILHQLVGNPAWVQKSYLSAPSALGLTSLSSFAVFP